MEQKKDKLKQQNKLKNELITVEDPVDKKISCNFNMYTRKYYVIFVL